MQINKEKVSVFISSRCDSVEDKKNGTVKYGVMRKSLKLMLEETGICNVYAFEESHATTVDVVHSYMRSQLPGEFTNMFKKMNGWDVD